MSLCGAEQLLHCTIVHVLVSTVVAFITSVTAAAITRQVWHNGSLYCNGSLENLHVCSSTADAYKSPSAMPKRPVEAVTAVVQAYDTPDFFSDDWLNDYHDMRAKMQETDCGQASQLRPPAVATSDYRFVYLGPAGSWTPVHADVLQVLLIAC